MVPLADLRPAWTRYLVPVGSGLAVVLLLVSLFLISDAIQNSERFAGAYLWLLLFDLLGIVFLAAVILQNIYRLFRRYRRRVAGARLTARFVMVFVALTLIPVSIVFYFSVSFLDRGIDSWFDVQVERALQDALELSQEALDGRMRNVLRRTEAAGEQLRAAGDELLPLKLSDLRQNAGAAEMTLLGQNNRIVASSSEDTGAMVPERPAEAILMQARQGQPYIGLDPIEQQGLAIRVVIPVDRLTPAGEPQILQALFPVDDRVSELAESVQDTFNRYEALTYLREPLKQSFTLTLWLALMLGVLAAVWMAFLAARRLLAPIAELAEGTRAVAEGDYDTRLPVSSRDELGFLVRSFNQMTRRIAESRDQARTSQLQAESQQVYLEAVLEHLSSGVLTLDPAGALERTNDAADQILGVPVTTALGVDLATLCARHAHLQPLCDRVLPHLDAQTPDWEASVRIQGAEGPQALIVRGTQLPPRSGGHGGYVLVVDEVTELIRAQRDAAWSEVARRLAHEIKNPLTPIQLSAERVRRKYLKRLPEDEAGVLDRSTRTIVQQVEAMKRMVDEFAEYARKPAVERVRLDLREEIEALTDLYRASPESIRLQLPDTPVRVHADPGALRQVLHNLVQNAQQALAGCEGGRIELALAIQGDGHRRAELAVRDNGPGFPPELLENIFEPYVTSRPRGTGLGLAIVKKLVDEQGGQVVARNWPDGGAEVLIRLPLEASSADREEESCA